MTMLGSLGHLVMQLRCSCILVWHVDRYQRPIILLAGYVVQGRCHLEREAQVWRKGVRCFCPSDFEQPRPKPRELNANDCRPTTSATIINLISALL